MLSAQGGADGADLDESLEALVFGMQFFVQTDGFIVATAKLSINFLHTIRAAA